MGQTRSGNGRAKGWSHAPVAPRRAQLARDIVRLATQENWQRGYHITEQELVAQFGVSRSPVRAALKVLEQRGILQARRNQGYLLAQDRRDLERIRIEVPRTADDELYLKIIGDRSSAALPEAITQADLLRRYRTNRAQLARVLVRMTNEGIVVRLKGHGWRFLPTLTGMNSAAASYEFRLMVEPAMMLLTQFKVDQEAVQRLREDHLKLLDHATRRRPVDRAWTYDLDASFHESIAGFSGNAFVIQAIRQHNRLRRLIEYGGYGQLERVKAWAAEHLAILQALRRGHLKRAAEHMRQHLTNAMNTILAAKH
jgi:DNA-binding GntR family transcriptional regulator